MCRIFAKQNLVFDKIKRNFGQKFVPKNKTQIDYFTALQNPTSPIVIATGPAGTAKTFISTLVGIELLVQEKVRKLVITRPAVSVDNEEHGFLPGDINSKMRPWMMPVFDILSMSVDKKEIIDMINSNLIEISPLAYMRGRSFDNSYIIFDEAQNCTPSQMLMIMTRIGNNSKLVITGDPDQNDRIGEKNGLSDLLARLDSVSINQIKQIKFDNSHVVRHPIIPEILDLYKNNF